jgi:hypothetical protein
MHTLTRRSALTAGVAALATGTAATALAITKPVEPDPIFAAIEARKQAVLGYKSLTHDASDDEGSAVCEADAAAARAMFRTVPATLAGAVALLGYVSDCESRGDDIGMVFMDRAAEKSQLGHEAMIESLLTSLSALAAQS